MTDPRPTFLSIPRRPPRASSNPRTITATMRARVLERDDFRCRRCGHGSDVAPLVVDHVIPVAKGGQATFDNLQTLCQPCNAGKSDRDPHPHDTGCGETKPIPRHAPAHPLAGMYVHTFKDGALHRQGQVVKVGDGLVMLQLFSWMSGEATSCEVATLDESKTWRLYESARDWRYGAALIQHQQSPNLYDHPDKGGWFDKHEEWFSAQAQGVR